MKILLCNKNRLLIESAAYFLLDYFRKTLDYFCIELLNSECVLTGDTIARVKAVSICLSFVVKSVFILVADILKDSYSVSFGFEVAETVVVVVLGAEVVVALVVVSLGVLPAICP